MAVDTKTSPLVIFGLDAGDADLIERWAQEGYLPAISSIMRRGCWGTLTGPEQITEHGVWISLLSGISRAQHGYYHWRPLTPGTYELHCSDLREVDAPPFWARLQGRNKNVVTIDALEARPVAGLSGVQLANWATHNPQFDTCTEPADLLTELRRRFGPQLRVEEKVDGSTAQDGKTCRGLLEQIAQKGALSRHLVTTSHFDVVFVGFSEAHIAAICPGRRANACWPINSAAGRIGAGRRRFRSLRFIQAFSKLICGAESQRESLNRVRSIRPS